MNTLLYIGCSLLLVSCHAEDKEDRRFPDDFVFGVATAAHQIEGAWNIDDKGENIWDHLTHTKPYLIKDRSNADIAANSYYNYKRDVEMMRELGLDVYRFSLSWSRILPNGLSNKVNKAAINFYNNYINEMLKYNITPIATLYHWDLPQIFQDFGGFLNPLFPEWFEDYSRIAFENFGDRVKIWVTLNEPREICYQGYGAAEKAPVLNVTSVGTYICAKHLVLAHARAYHVYTNEFKPTQNGECGITVNIDWFAPATDTERDHFAAEIARQSEWGIYTEPIFSKQGGFPKELSEIVARKSKEQGFKKSRMPEFTDEEKKFVRGTYDFFGMNHYTSYLISATEHKMFHPVPSVRDDIDVGIYKPDEWPASASEWLKLAPNSLYDSLIHLHKKYNNPIFYITENGWSQTPDVGLIDDDRITYHRAKLNEVLDCLEAGVNVQGYMAWSLMDNFEWMQGYTERFGLYQVDYKSEERTRTPRKSAFVYKQILKTRVIDPNYEPTNLPMTIDKGH